MSVTASRDQATDTFLRLIDVLDGEANAVAHAVVRAQAAVRSMVDDSRGILDRPTDDRRSWAEASVRLMQHRAILVEALNGLRRPSRDSVLADCPATPTLRIPVPPRPLRTTLIVEMPVPPKPLWRVDSRSAQN